MTTSPDKRRTRLASFRHDLGRKRSDEEGSEDDVEKRSYYYRMRGGKAFKADLGKRLVGWSRNGGSGSSLFRSDLGRRSDGVQRRRTSLFRSDLGKRSPLPPVPVAGRPLNVSLRRMFRADLGKRAAPRRLSSGSRVYQFRHDLG